MVSGRINPPDDRELGFADERAEDEADERDAQDSIKNMSTLALQLAASVYIQRAVQYGMTRELADLASRCDAAILQCRTLSAERARVDAQIAKNRKTAPRALGLGRQIRSDFNTTRGGKP